MAIVILLLYGSLLAELLFFHVPSVANTKVFFTNQNLISSQYNKYLYVFKWSKEKKIIFLLIPHFINIFIFFVPLLLLYGANKPTTILLITGATIAVLGRILSFSAMLQIRQNNSQQKDDFTLHTNGLFSFSRNPIQIGMYLFYVGICFINFNPILIICFLFYFIYNDFRIKIEEDFLEMKFKDLYTNYKLKTRRYL